MPVTQVDLPDLAATEAFGRRLGAVLFPGAVVALIGPLGAGKTHIVAAIAEGLGLRDRRLVASPTFGLIHEYPARLPIYHFDVYRLKNLAEFQDLGAHEYFEGAGVCLIEWADKVEPCLPDDYLRIEIDVTGETTRRLHLAAAGARHQALAEAMKVKS